MRRRKTDGNPTAWSCLLAMLLGACFSGDFVLGLPCHSNDDCGPELSCIGGFCGGLGDTPVCGNHLREAGEECDDGNTDENDDCTPACLRPTCGDGFLAPSEQCDDGNTMQGDDCTPICRVAICGDGFLGPGEACDDGNDDDDDQCTSQCVVPTCGDGRLDAGEECDDGNDVDTDACTSTCHEFRCGDGYVGPGEECDDGNDVDADECTSSCRLPVCGDGFHYAKEEECDDGNDVDIDVCTTECTLSPESAPELELSISQIKQFDFVWDPVFGAAYYRLLESADAGEDFVQVGEDVVGDSLSLTVPLHLRANARYKLAACNSLGGCRESDVVEVTGTLASAVGYFKASNTDPSDYFGSAVALSADGNTLAVGAVYEDGDGTGIDDEGTSNEADHAGAVYVFVRDQDTWSQQAYLKASNTDAYDLFGATVALSADGSTLAVGAPHEDGDSTGIDGDEASDAATNAGAVYVFVRDQDSWSQRAYVKASNTGAGDGFGGDVALSADGSTMAVGAAGEESTATGIDGDGTDDSTWSAGAAYVFVRDQDTWSQQAYVKASITAGGDYFGGEVALSADGDTLAVGARGEDSNATGVDGDGAHDAFDEAGAVYVFTRDLGSWSQQAYIKASNPGDFDSFGGSVALSSDGDTLAVGAHLERSDATGINGDESSDAATNAGAAYVFIRELGTWSQQAYVKSSNNEAFDLFGASVALSADGNLLAVGAYGEDGSSAGIQGASTNGAMGSGAAYVFARDQGTWSQHAYVKASNASEFDYFGGSTALSADGATMAVGAYGEGSNATGVGGLQASQYANSSGAVYLY